MMMNDDQSHCSLSGCHIAVGDVATDWQLLGVTTWQLTGGCWGWWVSASGHCGHYQPPDFVSEEIGKGGLSWV